MPVLLCSCWMCQYVVVFYIIKKNKNVLLSVWFKVFFAPRWSKLLNATFISEVTSTVEGTGPVKYSQRWKACS